MNKVGALALMALSASNGCDEGCAKLKTVDNACVTVIKSGHWLNLSVSLSCIGRMYTSGPTSEEAVIILHVGGTTSGV